MKETRQWERKERGKERVKENEGGGREKAVLLPPYFVNNSDLQDKRSATLQINSERIIFAARSTKCDRVELQAPCG